MGVWGLQTFLEKVCRGATIQVDLKAFVEEYKRRNGTDVAEVLISVKSASQTLYGPLNWVLGKQLKEFKARVETFIQFWEEIGAKLVVFDGNVTVTKRRVWIDRRLWDNQKNLLIFEHLDQGEPVPPDVNGNYSVGSITFLVLKELGVDIRLSIDEVDEDMAEYARTNCSFACIADDTDFVIYNAAKYFLSLRSLNMTARTVNRYDTVALAQHLNIPMSHLPLLATLCGNDIVRRNKLLRFHEWIKRRSSARSKFVSVAEYIRQFRGVEIMSRLEEISFVVFGDVSGAEDLEKSIRSYLPRTTALEQPMQFPDSHWGRILSQAWTLSQKSTCQWLYPVLTGCSFEMTTSLEDITKNDLPSSFSLLAPIRERIYGILLMERPGGVDFVDEWDIHRGNEMEKLFKVNPVIPEKAHGCQHPGLLALWSDDDSYSQQRWQLLTWAAAPQLRVDTLRSLPARLVVPAVVLHYLRTNMPEAGPTAHVAQWELAALGVQAVLLASTDPRVIHVEPPYSTRAIRLASIFMRAVAHVLFLLAACGFPLPVQQTMPWLYFDGVLFHSVYQAREHGTKSLEELCVNQDGESLYQEFTQLQNCFTEE